MHVCVALLLLCLVQKAPNVRPRQGPGTAVGFLNFVEAHASLTPTSEAADAVLHVIV